MRSPKARELLNEVLKKSRESVLADGTSVEERLLELGAALMAYDEFCALPHYTLTMDPATSTPTVKGYETGTQGDHFQLPTGR